MFVYMLEDTGQQMVEHTMVVKKNAVGLIIYKNGFLIGIVDFKLFG